MEENEKQYAKGFNNGYLIAKHEPELYTTLSNGLDSKNEYIEGFVSGGKEYEIEKHISKSEYLHNKAKNKEKDFEKDR